MKSMDKKRARKKKYLGISVSCAYKALYVKKKLAKHLTQEMHRKAMINPSILIHPVF